MGGVNRIATDILYQEWRRLDRAGDSTSEGLGQIEGTPSHDITTTGQVVRRQHLLPTLLTSNASQERGTHSKLLAQKPEHFARCLLDRREAVGSQEGDRLGVIGSICRSYDSHPPHRQDATHVAWATSHTYWMSLQPSANRGSGTKVLVSQGSGPDGPTTMQGDTVSGRTVV